MATAQVNNVFGVGGIYDPTSPPITIPIGDASLIILGIGIDSYTGGTPGNRLALYKRGSIYQITSGKTLRAVGFTLGTNASGGLSGSLYHGWDTAAITNNSTSSGTDVFARGVAANPTMSVITSNTNVPRNFPIPMEWAGGSGNYPWVRFNAGGTNIITGMFYCYEY